MRGDLLREVVRSGKVPARIYPIATRPAYSHVDAVQVGCLVCRCVDRLSITNLNCHTVLQRRLLLVSKFCVLSCSLMFFGLAMSRLLVQNGINGNSCLSSLPIANDELSLATANGDQAVYSLQPGGPRSNQVRRCQTKNKQGQTRSD